MGKLPERTLLFWVMKICATSLGETVGDLLSMTMHVGYAASSLVLIGFFLLTLVVKLATNRSHARGLVGYAVCIAWRRVSALYSNA